MTQVAEDKKTVLVRCLGIACPTGFNLNPEGYEPSFITFHPGAPVALPVPYADWLVAQDSAKFSIEKIEAAQPDAQPKKAAKAAKK